jgi:copper chaperone
MKTKLQVEGMSCEHCVKALTEALKAVPGVKAADVRL